MIFERLKKLYKDGKIKDLSVYVEKGLITKEQVDKILKEKESELENSLQFSKQKGV